MSRLVDIERSPTQPCKGGRCRRRALYPARKLAIFVIFHHFFCNGSHAYISIFNISIALLGTDEHIAKIYVSNIEIFMEL